MIVGSLLDEAASEVLSGRNQKSPSAAAVRATTTTSLPAAQPSN